MKGCTSLKSESLKQYETSNMHLFLAKKNMQMNRNKKKPPAMKAKLSLNNLAMDRLTILFLTVHTINLQGWPASDYCWMSELDEVKGLNIGKVYQSSQKCCEFADATVEIQCNEFLKHLVNCKLFW